MTKLKTGKFKKLYKLLKTPFTPLNWLILGFLVGVEDQYIELSIKQNLDSEIHRYKEEQARLYNNKKNIVYDKDDDSISIYYKWAILFCKFCIHTFKEGLPPVAFSRFVNDYVYKTSANYWDMGQYCMIFIFFITFLNSILVFFVTCPLPKPQNITRFIYK